MARIVLPLLALSALAACGDNPDTLLAKAQKSFAEQDYQAARSHLISGLDKRPGDTAMLQLLVRSQIGLGDADGAERSLGRLERAGLKGKSLEILKARIALLKGEPAQALDLIGNDQTVQAWLVRAQANQALGDDNAAKQSFEKGMAAGDDIDLASAYARFALQQNDLTLAERIVQRMRAISVDAYETNELSADIAAARGETDKAIAGYRSVMAAHPDRVAPVLALANQFDMQGKLDEAIKLVEQAGKIEPDNSEVEDMKYQLLAEKGEWEKIRIGLQGRESSLDPTSGLGMRYAEALLRLGFSQQARIMFKRAALMLPGNPYSRMMLGEAQLASGDPQGAWDTLKPLASSTLARPEVLQSAEKAARAVGAPEAEALHARLQPARIKQTMALVERGDAAVMQRDWKTVAEVYGTLSQRGDDPEVLKRLALAADGLGQPREAIAFADRTLAMSPENPDYLYLAGHIRLNAGIELGKARTLLESAASADPRNQVIARELKKAEAAAS